MKTSRNIMYIWLYAATLALVCGCTREEFTSDRDATQEVTLEVSSRSIVGQTVDGITVSRLRIVVVDPATGYVAVNRTSDGDLQDTGTIPGTGNLTLTLKAGNYRIYTIGNETVAMTAILRGLTNGNLIETMAVQTPSAETELILFNRTLIRVKPAADRPAELTAPLPEVSPGVVMVGGSGPWLDVLPVSLERLAAKITFALKKNTVQASDKFTVKRVAIVQLPLYSYTVPRAYAGGGFRSVTLYDNPTGITFTNNGEAATPFGSAIVPEYLLGTQATDYASSIKVLVNYNDIADLVYTINLPGNQGNNWNIYRNTSYLITATITQPGSLDYTPYVEYAVSPWTDATGEDLNIGGSITSTGKWSASTTVVNNNTVAVYSNSYVEYSFTLANPRGATWRASLTNGLDFAFDYSDNAVSSGVAAPGQPYTIRVKPLRPVSVSGVQTKMYITVNNVTSQTEIDLVPSQPGVRYTITQIPQ